MEDKIKERFDFHYENDSVESFIVISMGSKEKILEYQIEMISNNTCPGILKLDARYKNHNIKLHYNITSKLALSQFLLRKKLNKNEFIDIILGITRPLLNSNEYLLYDKSFLIDENYIYINPSTLEIGMIYLPIVTDINTNEVFQNFLNNLIISSAKIDESSNGNYIAKILNYLKKDVFNIYDLDVFLKELKDDEPQIVKSNKNHTKKSLLNSLDGESIPINQDKYINQIPKYEEDCNEKLLAHRERNILNASSPKEFEKDTETMKKKYKSKHVLIAIVCQILIAIILSLSLNKIKLVLGDDLSTIGGIILIVAAVDILILKNLFKKENIKIQPKSLQENRNINMSKREIYNIYRCENNAKGYEELAASDEVTDISLSNINETIVLGEEKGEVPSLQRMNNGVVDNISINKSHFIIGRLSNYVDHLIDNNAIGRTHAEILCREEQYFIKDLNSKNGTFLNEEKLNSNMEYAINNGDKVKFANIEYTFIL